MPTAWLDLPAPPALPGLFLRAALRRGIRGKALPERGLRSQVTVDPKHLERYRQVCGFRDDGLLPPTYPHILAFPLQMALLTDKRFPFPLLGLVHLENRIDVLRALGGPAVHRERRGGKPATARQGRHLQHRHPPGRPAWPALGRRQQGALPRRQGARRDSAESRAGAAAAGAGRQLEGARRHRPALCPCRRRLQPDPPVGAQRQAVRLSRAIAHGLWNKARSLAALGERLPASGYRVEVRFQKPVLLPASLTLLASAAAADGQFSLRGKDDLPHMAGHWSRLQG